MAKKKARKKPRPSKAKPIPAGFHTIAPYLTITGAAEAIEFYKKAFGAKEVARQAMPDGKILHARIKIGDSMVMMSDEFPGSDMKSPGSLGTSTVTLHIYSKDVNGLWQQAVLAGGRVVMPLENQFWGERYGVLADPFGHRWSLSMQVKMSLQEMEAKRQEAMAMFGQGQHPGMTA